MGNHFDQSTISISMQPSQYKLFDFHKEISKKTVKSTMVFPSYLKQTNSKLQYSQRCNFNDREYEINISQENRQPILNLRRQIESSDRVWKVLDVNETVEIKEKDVIKLGETQLVVRKICKNYQDLDIQQNLKTVSDLDVNQSRNIYGSILKKSHLQLYDSRQKRSFLNQSKLESRFYQRSNNKNSSQSLIGDPSCCRVCFSKKTNSQNPLLNLCICSGSIKNIHYQCMKSWIQHNSKHQSYDSYEYLQYDLSCDICKTKIDKTITHNNRKYTIFTDYINHPPFVILSYKNKKNSTKIRQFIINFDHKDNLLLGKDKSCDILLSDRFISRQHCELNYQNNKLFVRNLNPSFGTFVNFKEYILINQLTLMIKNTLIKIEKEKGNCCDSNALKICLQEELQSQNNN